MKTFQALLILLAAAAIADSAEVPAPAGLRLEIIPAQKKFALGEPIEVTLRYSYSGTKKFNVHSDSCDPNWIPTSVEFKVTDSAGNILPQFPNGPGCYNGLMSNQPLKPDEPFTNTALVNQFVRFDQPGIYSMTARSYRVSFAANERAPIPSDPKTIVESLNWSLNQKTGKMEALLYQPYIRLESEPVELEITPPDEKRRLERLARAPENLKKGEQQRYEAVLDLSFMMDTRAIPMLLQALADDAFNVWLLADHALDLFRDMASVKAAVLKAADDESHFIMPSVLDRYARILERGTHDTDPLYGKSVRKKYGSRVEKQLDQLPLKQAVRATVEGLIKDGFLSRDDPRHWRRLFNNPRLLDQDGQTQWSAVLAIENHCRNKALVPDLKQMMADSTLDARMLSAVRKALAAIENPPAAPAAKAEVPTLTLEGAATQVRAAADRLEAIRQGWLSASGPSGEAVFPLRIPSLDEPLKGSGYYIYLVPWLSGTNLVLPTNGLPLSPNPNQSPR